MGGQSSLHFHNQTIRQIVRVTLGGSRFRVVLSNTFGTAPLRIGAAQVALRDKDASIVPQSNRVLTFNGQAQTTVPAGAVLLSDPVDFAAKAFADLAIDLYLPDDTAATKSPVDDARGGVADQLRIDARKPCGFRSPCRWRRRPHIAAPTDLISATWFFITRVEVMAPASTGAVVTIGDSITDGTASTIDANNRWPDHFARRLAAAGVNMAVLNAGYGGNRVLTDGNGPSALSRFDRDVIAQPGVTHVVVLEGINDIGQARNAPSPSAADPDRRAQADDRARACARPSHPTVRRSRRSKVRIDWTPEGEAKRQALNDWIRYQQGLRRRPRFRCGRAGPAAEDRDPCQVRPRRSPAFERCWLPGCG